MRGTEAGLQIPEQPPAAVVQLVAQVMAEVTSVSKDDQFNGGQTRYAYRGVDRVVKALSASMRKHGLVMLPAHTDLTAYTPVQTSQGKPASLARVVVTYRLYGPAGDYLEVSVPGEAMDSGDKAVSKAMSVAWRTALLQGFFLPTEEPDPDSENYELGKPPQQIRGGGSPAAMEKLRQYDQRQQQPGELPAAWKDALEAAGEDLDALWQLYTDAVQQKAPKQVQDAISAVGNAVKAKQAAAGNG